MMEDQNTKIEAVIRAWKNEGVYPPYHRDQVERLRNEWPTLYRALRDLAR